MDQNMRNWYPGERQAWNLLLRLPWIRWRVLIHFARKGWIVKASDSAAGDRHDEAELELHCDDEIVASVCGPRDDAMIEMRRYWSQYCADGKCSVYEVTRTQVNIEDVLGIGDALTVGAGK